MIFFSTFNLLKRHIVKLNIVGSVIRSRLTDNPYAIVNFVFLHAYKTRNGLSREWLRWKFPSSLWLFLRLAIVRTVRSDIGRKIKTFHPSLPPRTSGRQLPRKIHLIFTEAQIIDGFLFVMLLNVLSSPTTKPKITETLPLIRWPAIWPPQVPGQSGGRVRRVRHQRRGGVQAECQQEREARDRAPAVRRGHVRERYRAAGARVARRLRPAHRAHLHAGRRRRLHRSHGLGHRLGPVEVRWVLVVRYLNKGRTTEVAFWKRPTRPPGPAATVVWMTRRCLLPRV